MAQEIYSKNRILCPKGGNDRVYTPPELAKQIVENFVPIQAGLTFCEPCRGKGAFSNSMPDCDWFELDEDRDFLTSGGHWDWVITNPPWSKFRAFLNKSMEVADNVVFLSLLNAWFMKARVRDMRQAGFGIVEILMLETPSEPWPQAGFQLSAVHIKRNYTKNVKINYDLLRPLNRDIQ